MGSHGEGLQADAHIPPTGHVREKPPQYPNSVAQWKRHTDIEIHTFGQAYGNDHIHARTKARDQLIQLHEDNPHEYPPPVIYGIWEELNWRCWEEFKMEFRALLREMDTESPTKADLKFHALSLDETGHPRFRFPAVVNLEDPAEYY